MRNKSNYTKDKVGIGRLGSCLGLEEGVEGGGVGDGGGVVEVCVGGGGVGITVQSR